MFSDFQKEMLAAPLDSARISKRQGAGSKTFDHIEGWDAMAHANKVFGFDGWSRETVVMTEVWAGIKVREYTDGRTREAVRKEVPAVAYTAKVRVTVYAGDRTIVREGTGFGNGEGPNLGDAHELAVKEAETDALKRALVSFGHGFGLALYQKGEREHVAKGVDDHFERRREEEESREQAPPSPPPPAPKQEPKERETRAVSDTPEDRHGPEHGPQQEPLRTRSRAPAAEPKQEPKREPAKAPPPKEERREPEQAQRTATLPPKPVLDVPKVDVRPEWEAWGKCVAAWIRTKPDHDDVMAWAKANAAVVKKASVMLDVNFGEWLLTLADKYCRIPETTKGAAR